MIGLARAPRIAAIVAAIGADRRRPQTACRDALGDDNAPGLDLLVHPIQSFTFHRCRWSGIRLWFMRRTLCEALFGLPSERATAPGLRISRDKGA